MIALGGMYGDVQIEVINNNSDEYNNPFKKNLKSLISFNASLDNKSITNHIEI